ncbi:MAG: abortive infection family protein, partial [Anaerolineae bacterium]|nr:abortive infection family protein [Anaerolineae bacterium]
AVTEASPTAFDLSKALVESTIKTILTDRGVVYGTWDFPKLFKEVLKVLELCPDDYEDHRKATEGLKRILRGLQQVVQGMSELRNIGGFASHGPDGYYRSLDLVHAQLSARAADAIVHFLYSIHRQYPLDLDNARLHYEDYNHFNDYLDDVEGDIEIAGMMYKASWLLFVSDLEHQAYRETLIGYQQRPGD